MIKYRLAAVLLAFGSLAVLPACSMTSSRTSSAAPASNQELSPAMVRQVQTSLQQQGFYNGNIDGLWGPQTQGAVQSFQQAHALRATGELNSPTLAALNVPGNGAAPAMQPAPADTTSSAAPATSPPMPAVAATSGTPSDQPTP